VFTGYVTFYGYTTLLFCLVGLFVYVWLDLRCVGSVLTHVSWFGSGFGSFLRSAVCVPCCLRCVYRYHCSTLPLVFPVAHVTVYFPLFICSVVLFHSCSFVDSFGSITVVRVGFALVVYVLRCLNRLYG